MGNMIFVYLHVFRIYETEKELRWSQVGYVQFPASHYKKNLVESVK